MLNEARRFNVMDCGRRFGKTVLAVKRLSDPALQGKPTFYFAPNFPMLSEVWRNLQYRLAPVTKQKSQSEHRLELVTGGVVRCWSLDNIDSVRGQKCAHAVIDEACLIPKLQEAWENSIRPTLTDFKGSADFLSTPKGMDYFWQLYTRGQSEDHPDWKSWQFPTTSNPYIDPSEVEAARLELPERVFRQEYLAEFLEDGAGVFRGVREVIDAGRITNEPSTTYPNYLGVDLARVEDFTVLNVLNAQGVQIYHERFNQITWERQIASITRVAKDYRAKIVIDSTGVGDPIYERLRLSGLDIEGYGLTNPSKEALIDNLAMLIEQGKVRLMDLPTQTAELLAYEYSLSPSRKVTMNAPSGMHDDCVISLAMSAWGLRAPLGWGRDSKALEFLAKR